MLAESAMPVLVLVTRSKCFQAASIRRCPRITDHELGCSLGLLKTCDDEN